MSKALIVAGFHRSGTSMLTQQLREMGCKLPSHLVGPNITNPDGHFEDFRVIQLHDQLLKQHGQSWQFTGDVQSLTGDSYAISEVFSQLSANMDSDETLLIKDPRICLFLNDWQRILSDRVSYVFVARHWLYSVESLLSRHSKRIAEEIKTGNLNRHFNFWLEPTLAPKMWLAYNEALLDFKRQHPDKVILFTQRGLSDTDVLAKALRQFLPPGNCSVAVTNDPQKARNSVSNRILDYLPPDLVSKLNKLWHAITVECDHKAIDETVMFYTPTKVTNSDGGNDNDNDNHGGDLVYKPILQWTCVEATENAISQENESLSVQHELALINQKLDINNNSQEMMFKKAKLLKLLNHFNQASSLLSDIIVAMPQYMPAWVEMFDLLDITRGFKAASIWYQENKHKFYLVVPQIENRLLLRNNFVAAKGAYKKRLINMSTPQDKQAFMSCLLSKVSNIDAKQDLSDRIWELWTA